MAIGSTNAQGVSGMIFKGATSVAGGRRGLVPTTQTGDEKKVLLGNGEFGDAPIPVASDSVLGGVKIGNTLSIGGDGTLNYNLSAGTVSVLGGVKSSSVEGGVTINADGTMKANPTKETVDKVTADTAWAEDTEYKVNNIVGYGGAAYICLVAHTSSSDFDADYALGCWSKVEAPKVGASGYLQVLDQGVTGASSSAPHIKSLAINATKDFILPPIEVLEETAGQSVILNDLHFDNTDADDFNYNAAYVTFDGTMHLKTTFDVPMSAPQEITDGTTTGYISESDNIDFGDYKTVEGVDVG